LWKDIVGTCVKTIYGSWLNLVGKWMGLRNIEVWIEIVE
jgi:hypothetical protein